MSQSRQQIWSLIFDPENYDILIKGNLLSLINIVLDIFTPLELATSISVLGTKEPAVFLGIEFSPYALLGTWGATSTVNNLFSNWRNKVFCPLAPRITRKLVSKFLDSQLRQPASYHRTISEGQKVNLANKCYSAVSGIINELALQIIPNTAEITFAVGLLSQWYGPEIGIDLAAILISFIGYNYGMTKYISVRRERFIEQSNRTTTAIEETLSLSDVIFYFSNRRKAIQKLEVATRAYEKAEIEANSSIYNVSFGQTLISSIGFYGTLLYFGYDALQNPEVANDLYYLAVYFATLAYTLAGFGPSVHTMYSSWIELRAVYREMDSAPPPQDQKELPDLKIGQHSPSIEFKGVSFSHNKVTPVLSNISLTIEPGQVVGIVGPSGSGKSTIMELISGIHKPDEGVIEIDGQNIATVNIASLVKNISAVLQTAFISNWTILDNVAFGKDASESEATVEEVMEALKVVNLDEHVKTLPQELQTSAGEKGTKMSGGQRQRLSIARALVKPASILFFDEATSSLDSACAKNVLDIIHKIAKAKNRTIIIISHKLSELMMADKIFVLSDSKIVQSGTHKELMEQTNGYYARAWDLQHKLDSSDSAEPFPDNKHDVKSDTTQLSRQPMSSESKVVTYGQRHFLMSPPPANNKDVKVDVSLGPIETEAKNVPRRNCFEWCTIS